MTEPEQRPRREVQPRPVEVVAGALDDPRFAVLLAALVTELQVRYRDAGAAGAPLVPAAFAPPDGGFLVAVVAGEPVGCGGLRRHSAGVGELKRMYVAPTVRGRGIARLLLSALEDSARTLGYCRLVLETGTAQPEAVALYGSAGWYPVPPYGEWRCSPESVCFGRDLGAPVPRPPHRGR